MTTITNNNNNNSSSTETDTATATVSGISSSFTVSNNNNNCCPLCCNEFTTADLLYPIHCPTVQCHYQYCMICIENLMKSSNDAYSEASDGSYQVKVSLRCPMCRASYRTTTTSHHNPTFMGVITTSTTPATAAAGGVSVSSPNAVSNTIVSAILKLRQAASIHIPSSTTISNNNNNNNKSTTLLLHNNDSDLSASQLAQRNHFLINNGNSSIIQELKDDIYIVQQYYDSIDCKDCGTVPTLPWKDWEYYIQSLQKQEQQQQIQQLSNMAILSSSSTATTTTTLNNHTTTIHNNISDATVAANSSSSSSSSSSSTTTPQSLPIVVQQMISRDPTLFMGLDELLTYDEQEFITHMMISGDAELIAQAAHLLHSIMCTMMMVSSSSSQQHSVTSNDNNSNHNTTTTKVNTKKKPKTTAQMEHEMKIRKKFPLPNHMPRVVNIPPYNPLYCVGNHHNKNNSPIKFIPPPPPKQQQQQQAVSKAKDGNNNNTTATTTTNSNISKVSMNQSSTITTQSKVPTAAAISELTLAGVSGIAGRVGLRRGDIITHVNNERVSTFSEYTIAVQYALEHQEMSTVVPEHRSGRPSVDAAATMTITVNANIETAQQLLQRAQQMTQQKIRFHC